MPPKEGLEVRKVERFPTVEVLLTNMQEAVDISLSLIRQHRARAARQERNLVKTDSANQEIREATRRREVLDELQSFITEVKEVIKSFKKISKTKDVREVQGEIRSAMSSYKELQRALRRAETAFGPVEGL